MLGLHAIVASRFEGRFPDLVPYSSYYLEIGIVVLLFAGITTPDLLCPDRRNRVLSLYLSTAVSRDRVRRRAACSARCCRCC